MKKLVNLRLDEEFLARVDAAAGRRGRTRFIERALEAALDRSVVTEEKVREVAAAHIQRERDLSALHQSAGRVHLATCRCAVCLAK